MPSTITERYPRYSVKTEDGYKQSAPGSYIGRMVLYVLPDGKGTGRSRPALIVNDLCEGDLVNLQVFPDGTNDLVAGADVPFWVSRIPYDAQGLHFGTWHHIDQAPF